MHFHNVLFATALAFVLLMVFPLRWVVRKVKLRRAWAGINSERLENKRAFARLAAQVAELEPRWRPGGKSQLSGTDPSPAEAARALMPMNLPAFPDQQWQAVVASGTAAMMTAGQRREVEELYIDLARLRASAAELSAAAATAGASGPGSTGRDEIRRLEAAYGALSQLVAEMQRFQPLHTDFEALDLRTTAGGQ